jgi:iron complex outermembrane receptor protein
VSPRLTLGGETFQRNWDAVNSFRTPALVADQNIIPNVNTTVAGAYAQYQRSLTDRIRVGGGVRLDTAHMYARSRNVNQALFDAYKGETALARRDTNPSANARLTLGVTSSLEAFAGVATSVRIPDAQERYINHRRMGADWVGNPGLRPARNNETNLGLNLRNGRWFVRTLGFYHGLDDFIVVHNQSRRTPVPGVMNLRARSYENVAARMYGGEFSYGAALGRRWLLSGGAAITRGLRDPRPELGIFSTNLPEVPPLKARLALRYGTRAWFVQAEPVAARSQRRVDTDLLEPVTPGWATLHLRAGWHARGWSVTAGADNLFDRFYYEHLSFQRDPFRSGLRVPEPGRNFYLNLGREF